MPQAVDFNEDIFTEWWGERGQNQIFSKIVQPLKQSHDDCQQ